GVIAMVVSIVVGPHFIAFLRRNEFGQHIRAELPERHKGKQGTPTMGGLLILVVATAAFLAVSKYKVPALTVLFVTLGCGAVGFLGYRAFPAEVIMGDTGAMALGGALAAFAIFTKTIFLLLLIGGIFVIEALSVIIQVVAFKYDGRRVFLIAPIHYHFEMKAWSETKIMVRFWIVSAILCAIGFALFYRDFTFFRR